MKCVIVKGQKLPIDEVDAFLGKHVFSVTLVVRFSIDFPSSYTFNIFLHNDAEIEKLGESTAETGRKMSVAILYESERVRLDLLLAEKLKGGHGHSGSTVTVDQFLDRHRCSSVQ